jgi:hypothetical protein
MAQTLIVPCGNPDNGDVDFLRGIESGIVDCLFRGPRLKIESGDRIMAYADGAIHGWIEFVGYDYYEGKNLQGDHVEKENALWIRGPFHEFDPPVPTPEGEHFNRPCYVHKCNRDFIFALFTASAKEREASQKARAASKEKAKPRGKSKSK